MHMFPEGVDDDLYTDYTKDNQSQDIEWAKDQVLLRNLITGEKVAAKKIHMLRRQPVDIPWKSVKNSWFFISKIAKLIKDWLSLKEIQVKDFQSIANEMLKREYWSKFSVAASPQESTADNEETKEDEPASEVNQPSGFTTANKKLKKNRKGNKADMGAFQTASTFQKSSEYKIVKDTVQEVEDVSQDVEMKPDDELVDMSSSQENKHNQKLEYLKSALQLIKDTQQENSNLNLLDAKMCKAYIESSEGYCQFLDQYYDFLSTFHDPDSGCRQLYKRHQAKPDQIKKFKVTSHTDIDWCKF